MYKIVDNAIEERLFRELKDLGYSSMYRPFKLDDTATMFFSPIKPELVNELEAQINNYLDTKVKTLISFFRLNNENVDESFRVHSDGLMAHRIVDVASVLYLDTIPDTGTALFKHPEHGISSRKGKIFTRDDRKWEAYERCYSQENRLFIYNASLFHGRFPWKVKDKRIVIVSFFKTI